MKNNPLIYWAVSTGVAAVMMLGYIHNFVYTRIEGEKLERRVDDVSKEYRVELRALSDKIDEIYRLLMQRRKREK